MSLAANDPRLNFGIPISPWWNSNSVPTNDRPVTTPSAVWGGTPTPTTPPGSNDFHVKQTVSYVPNYASTGQQPPLTPNYQPQPAPTQPPPSSNPTARGTNTGPTSGPTGSWTNNGGVWSFNPAFQVPSATSPAGSPWATNQAGNENRTFTQGGLDPRLDAVFGYGLQQAMNRYVDPNGQTYFSGQTVANLTPDELAAQNMLRSMAYGGMGGISDAGANYYTSTLDRANNPQNDPTLQAAIDAMSRDTMRSATDPGGIYQQIRQGAIQNGTMGSSRQGIAEGIASGRIADSIASQSAAMRLAGRGQNMQAAGSAFGNTGNALTAASAPAGALSGIGAQNRAFDQANLDSALRAWQYNTTQPDVRLQNLYNLMGATPFGGWQANSGTVGSDLLAGANGGTSGAQNALGIAGGGLALWSLLRNSGIL